MQLRGYDLVPFFFDKQVLLMETLLGIWRCEYSLTIKLTFPQFHESQLHETPSIKRRWNHMKPHH